MFLCPVCNSYLQIDRVSGFLQGHLKTSSGLIYSLLMSIISLEITHLMEATNVPRSVLHSPSCSLHVITYSPVSYLKTFFWVQPVFGRLGTQHSTWTVPEVLSPFGLVTGRDMVLRSCSLWGESSKDRKWWCNWIDHVWLRDSYRISLTSVSFKDSESWGSLCLTSFISMALDAVCAAAPAWLNFLLSPRCLHLIVSLMAAFNCLLGISDLAY